MVITWYGQACFKIQSGSTIVIVDPFDKSIGLTPPKIEANIVLVTHDHPDHNNIETIKGEPFVIDSPGEYEYQGVSVQGISSFHDSNDGEDRGLNTIYILKMEGIRIVHLGDLGQKTLTEKQLETLGAVDILMVPVGGVYTIEAPQALEITNQIEPKIVIPMHYKVKGLKTELADVSAFLKEIGQPDNKPEEKLTIKKNLLPQEQMDVVVFKI